MATKTLNIRIPVEMYDALTQQAAKTDRTRNRLVWRYLRLGLDADRDEKSRNVVDRGSTAL